MLPLEAEEPSAPCAAYDLASEAFLGCVGALLDQTTDEKSLSATVLNQPLRGLLEKLAATQGYKGSLTDLDKLKRRSTALKRAPTENRESISLLDTAIASHIDELVLAVSPRTLAAKADPGTDIHPKFVEQKLSFLTSDRMKFYDRGPFENVTRSLLANSIEESYFIEQMNDKDKIHEELDLVGEIFDRIDNQKGEYDYLQILRDRSQQNSNRFWRASLLFAAGEIGAARAALRDLATKNAHFDLDSPEPGHIYIYKVFDFPYEMIVQKALDSNGQRKIDINDPGRIMRYFNPAQLALVACAYVDKNDQHSIEKFATAINNLVFSDYYVVAASAEDATQLKSLDQAIAATMSDAKTREKSAKLTATLADQDVDGFANSIERGAKSCEIDDATRSEIYSLLNFRAEFKSIEKLAKHKELLLYGGRLNATQATTLAEFLNKTVLPEVGIRPENFAGDSGAFIVRMKLDQ